MKKQISILLLLALFIISACQKQDLRESELLQQRNALESATPNLLLSSIIQQSAFAYQAEGGVSNPQLAATVQYMQGNRNSDNNIYKGFALPTTDLYNFTTPIKLAEASISRMDSLKLRSYQGIFLIFKSFLWSTVTDLYGDIYYTQGLQGQNGILFPKFDDQKDIYPALIKNLKDAAKLIAAGKEAIDPTYDILYGGNKAEWIKFANSLQLRLLMKAGKNLPNAAAQIDSIAAQPLMTSGSDDAAIPYLAGDPTYSWPRGSSYMLYSGNYMIYRPSKTLVDTLKALADPRLGVWVAPVEKPWTNVSAQNGTSVTTIDPLGFSYVSTWEYIDRTNSNIAHAASSIVDTLTLYAGYTAGMYEDVLSANGSYDFPTTIFNYKISKFSQLLNQNSHALLKACMMQSDEVQFLLAEAAVKGYITGANPETLYNKGVTLALNRWGQNLPSGYFNNARAKFPTSGTDDQKLEKIALQKWLGLFMMGVEAYSDYRRTRLPFIELNGELASGIHKFPLRFRYPQTEMNDNAQQYQAAIAKLDLGDTEFSKMWLLQ